ncbi:MAG TPA: hypothetical protein VI728_00585 [Syntrophales bacterium]|nr:hypothetical protein [Syntrophales bacterium]
MLEDKQREKSQAQRCHDKWGGRQVVKVRKPKAEYACGNSDYPAQGQNFFQFLCKKLPDEYWYDQEREDLEYACHLDGFHEYKREAQEEEEFPEDAALIFKG